METRQVTEPSGSWWSAEVADYLKAFFTRAFMRARDEAAGVVQREREDRVRRGVGIRPADPRATEERSIASRTAFPEIVEEIKRLVAQSRIPDSADGAAFARDVVQSLVTDGSTDEMRRAAARAGADLRLFFQHAALPIVDADDPFIAKLQAEVPSAAAAYLQARHDLTAERLSYRGPANDLRQALWTVLEALAPDADVMSEARFRQDPNVKTGPTQRQRAEFIMRKRRGGAPSDAALEGIDAVARLTRAIYERSNDSTHRDRDREEALQVQRYVEAVLRDLLA
jgi:hypothetical protein